MSIFDDSNHNKTTYLERYIVQKEIDKKEISDKKSADFYTLLKLIFSFFLFNYILWMIRNRKNMTRIEEMKTC